MSAARSHCEAVGSVPAEPERLFAWLDEPRNLAGHMEGRSMAMMGSSMSIETDARGGREMGSVIRMRGRVLGIKLALEEAIVERDPPRSKAWRTLGEPRLLVIGAYELGCRVEPRGAGCALTDLIDYEQPKRHRWLGRVFEGAYAKRSCERMLLDAQRAFP